MQKLYPTTEHCFTNMGGKCTFWSPVKIRYKKLFSKMAHFFFKISISISNWPRWLFHLPSLSSWSIGLWVAPLSVCVIELGIWDVASIMQDLEICKIPLHTTACNWSNIYCEYSGQLNCGLRTVDAWIWEKEHWNMSFQNKHLGLFYPVKTIQLSWVTYKSFKTVLCTVTTKLREICTPRNVCVCMCVRLNTCI